MMICTHGNPEDSCEVCLAEDLRQFTEPTTHETLSEALAALEESNEQVRKGST
jgi:hypothetical protein